MRVPSTHDVPRRVFPSPAASQGVADAFVIGIRATAAVLLVAVGVLGLVVKFRHAVYQAFAIVCVLLGTRQLSRGLAHIEGQEDWWFAVHDATTIALLFAVTAFILAFLWPALQAMRWARWGLAAVASGLATWTLVDACATLCGDAKGPLYWLLQLPNLWLASAAAVLALSLDRAPGATGARARSVRIVAYGLALLALYFSISDGLVPWLNVPGNPAFLTRALGIAPAALALLLVCMREWREARGRTLIMLACAILISGAATWAGLRSPDATGPLMLASIANVLLPAMIAYALVRHRLFGIDLKVRWTLVRTPLAGLFLALFFIVGQMVERSFEGYGWLAGSIVAGLALFAIQPMQRLGERLASTVLPEPSLRKDKRLEIYGEQLRLVWEDGYMGSKERLLLDQLRNQLGITHEQASKLETEAAQSVRSAGRNIVR
jgi:hypothetical protein